MNIVFLNGIQFKTKDYAHEYIRSQFGFPEYYGKNLDALWDMLQEISKPTTITMINSQKVVGYLGDYGEALIELFEEAQSDIIKFVRD
ncbi:MAG: barstar family protein [Tissierellia bacterium]|nr:barstar family protein [Tissierellia bacterium]